MGDPRDIIRAVVAVLAADGKIGTDEQTFLDKLGHALGVGEGAVESALEEVQGGEMTLEFPEDVAERKGLFDVLVGAARADGSVEPEEAKILDLVASRLGILDAGGDGA